LSTSEPTTQPTSPDRLARYRAKRDFTITSEPSGSVSPEPGHRFVVQHHRARSPHYDFRLEAAGVLVSWAVPKGPTLDPKARRLAVHVEDHPLDYFDFEGAIPRGEYGGGDVIVWDWGTWRMAEGDDPIAAVDDGDLHFWLDGEKLQGRFVLVRRGARGDKEQWLLLHKQDEYAVPGWDPQDYPRSVKSGRTNDEVKADPDATWHSNRGDGDGASTSTSTSAATASVEWPAPTDDELAALDDLGAGGSWSFGDQTIKLSNLDKVLFPARGDAPAVTKRDLISYHARVANRLLPYLEGRPVNLRRFPDGVDAKGFWQKALPSHAPEWLTRFHYDDARAGETDTYLVLDSPAGLVWAANMAAVELNPWTSRVTDVHAPTWALVDIDPGTDTTFDDVLVLARLYRAALEHLGLRAGPKVTGQSGVQIWIPIGPGYGFDDTTAWVERLSRAVGATVPELVSWKWEKKQRGGRARLDFTQNAINKTLVAPFSTRPSAGAPVSVPITWDELDDPDLTPDRWTLPTVLDRIAEAGDPLRPLVGLDQRLPELG
jgi:bifunctional non-homologous end joining protein LigD